MQMEKTMNRSKLMAAMFFVSLMAVAVSPTAKATDYDKKTTVTFNQTIEIPGVGQQFLPAGTYVFKLVDSLSDRDIVQIFSQDEKKVLATILTIANYRLKATSKTVMTFRERASGEPEAIRAWFYPGANWGQEFVYPKARAIAIAKVAKQPVLAMPTELAPEIVKAEPPMETFKAAPLKAITPRGEEVEVAQVIPPKDAVRSLPKTSSSLPLLGLLGLLAIGSGLALSRIPKPQPCKL
jgi:hypothetical protein